MESPKPVKSAPPKNKGAAKAARAASDSKPAARAQKKPSAKKPVPAGPAKPAADDSAESFTLSEADLN